MASFSAPHLVFHPTCDYITRQPQKKRPALAISQTSARQVDQGHQAGSSSLLSIPWFQRPPSCLCQEFLPCERQAGNEAARRQLLAVRFPDVPNTPFHQPLHMAVDAFHDGRQRTRANPSTAYVLCF